MRLMGMAAWLLALALGLVALGAGLAEAQERRLALVMGNSEYQRTTRLPNPVNDANDMAVRLAELGYQVHGGRAHLNLSRVQMLRLMREFSGSLRAGDTALVYFAGHGAQFGGANYLIPVDDREITHAEDLPDFAVDANSLMRTLEAASGLTAILILDACRDNPLPSRTPGRTIQRGLTRMEVQAGSFIAFAAGEGETASDGTGRNGLFTGELLRSLSRPDRRLDDIFMEVRGRVRQASGQRQTPWTSSSLERAVYFTAAGAAAASGGSGGSASAGGGDIAPVVDPCASARADWPAIERSTDRAAVTVYRDSLPSSCTTLRALADARLRALQAAAAPRPTPAPAVSASAGGAAAGGAAGSAAADVAPRPTRRVGEVFRDGFTSGSGQGPEMVVLPSGSFTMGSPASEAGRNAERESPQRTVRIGYRLAVGRYEVTVDEYRAFATETGRSASGGCRRWDGSQWVNTASASWQSPGFTQSGNHPVTCVSWDDAQAYLTWLNRRTGLTGRPDRYRLPSEAEWEYAARAGSTTAYSFGNDAGQLGAHAWFRDNSNSRTEPVGGKRANAFGLHDMHGNVWEWVEDCWNDSLAGAPSDGSPRTTGNCSNRVIRGGSWYDIAQILRSAFRGGFTPGFRSYVSGFRLARTLPD